MQATDFVTELLRSHLNHGTLRVCLRPIAGGDIHKSFEADLGNQRFFIKLNDASNARVLASEFQSLQILHQLGAKHYPTPTLFEANSICAILVMSYHKIVPLTSSSAESLGRLLAEQHQISQSQFGWQANNYIGLTPQANKHNNSWVDFYRQQRLTPQLEMASTNGLSHALAAKIESVIDKVPELVDDNNTGPSLLHGDLWTGNVAFDAGAKRPLLYDPAPYFGDREADLAMTELFTRLPAPFYRAYFEILPKRPGHDDRRNLYNLYHALNHYNLFGAGYESMVQRYATAI